VLKTLVKKIQKICVKKNLVLPKITHFVAYLTRGWKSCAFLTRKNPKMSNVLKILVLKIKKYYVKKFKKIQKYCIK